MGEILVHIERPEVPIRVLEHHVFVEIVGCAKGAWPCSQRGPSDFTAALEARKNLLPGSWMLQGRVDLARGLDLRRGQAARPIGAGALNRPGIEVATEWIFKNAVFHA